MFMANREQYVAVRVTDVVSSSYFGESGNNGTMLYLRSNLGEHDLSLSDRTTAHSPVFNVAVRGRTDGATPPAANAKPLQN